MVLTITFGICVALLSSKSENGESGDNIVVIAWVTVKEKIEVHRSGS